MVFQSNRKFFAAFLLSFTAVIATFSIQAEMANESALSLNASQSDFSKTVAAKQLASELRAVQPKAVQSKAVQSIPAQRGQGLPYEMLGSEVWDITDPKSKRVYQIFVALPKSYQDQPNRRYPVLYVTDADYAFPLIRQIARRLNGDGPAISDFILVGLSYAKGDDAMASRRRDYTPTVNGAVGAPKEAIHGESQAYIGYLQQHVLPFVAATYRTDEQQRLFLGHSYGALLGFDILFTAPQLFAGYILGSPSLWYDDHVIWSTEQSYAKQHQDLPAKVLMYVGEYEDMKAGDARFAKRHNMVTDAQTMAKKLKARRYPSLVLTLDVLNDEDHLSVAPRGFIKGLKFLLAEPKTN